MASGSHVLISDSDCRVVRASLTYMSFMLPGS